MKLLVNNVPLRRILEIAEISPARLYNRIDFLAEQCRNMAAVKERNLWRGFKDHNRVISTDVQTILANWRHAHRVLNVPILHAVSVERDTGYVIAATTDFDSSTDPSDVERSMLSVGDFSLPRAYRQHGRVWAREEYESSVLRGVQRLLSDEEKMVNTFDLPGAGARVRGDIFQAAHMMLVKKLIGDAFYQVLYAIDGDIGLAKLTTVLNARAVKEGRVHVADVRFTKELGNRKRNQLVQLGDQMLRHDEQAFARARKRVEEAYNLRSDIVKLIAARLLTKYGATYVSDRGHDLAENGFYWRYHRKEEPEKKIWLLTDRGDLTFGDLAILLTRASMAPTDKYFALIRRRIKAFDRGSRPISGETTWYVNAYYDPAMIDKVATIFRFYYNFMLVESAESGKKKEDRQTPAMKIGLTKGKVFMRDLLSYS